MADACIFCHDKENYFIDALRAAICDTCIFIALNEYKKITDRKFDTLKVHLQIAENKIAELSSNQITMSPAAATPVSWPHCLDCSTSNPVIEDRLTSIGLAFTGRIDSTQQHLVGIKMNHKESIDRIFDGLNVILPYIIRQNDYKCIAIISNPNDHWLKIYSARIVLHVDDFETPFRELKDALEYIRKYHYYE